MAVKQTGRKQHISMQGKAIDMDLLRQKNELTPAVGNVRVNARGDELGPGGKIIRKREEVMADYYRDHPDAVPDEIPGQGVEVVEKEPTVVPKAKKPKATTKKATTKVEEETKVEEPVAQDDWVEDDDGNFVKKGD
tara:strand:+ start:3114 stop:3521 length:408 start_codon:yes stop_codon:yes gene_type:complete